MPDLLDASWAPIIRNIQQWQRNFRVTGADFRNSEQGAALAIRNNGEDGDREVVRRVPVKIEGPLTADGIYAVRFGGWKAELDESGSNDGDSLFDFPSDPNAVAFIWTEVLNGGHALSAGDVTFGYLHCALSSNGQSVIEILITGGIIDLRYSTDTHAIEVTFDGSMWIPKIFFSQCSADVTVTT